MPIPPHVTPKLRLDRAKTKASLPPNLAATDTEVDAALASINQDALYDEARAKVTVELWDRVSPINGVPAEHFEQRGDLPEDGDVYLTIENGRVVGYQPHEPDLEGLVAIPKGQGLTRGKEKADKMVAERVSIDVIDRVRKHILTQRGNPA